MERVKIRNRVTLSDIAKHAGTSLSTASAVLRDKAVERRISTEMVIRVREAASKLDYSPNLLVQSMQAGQTDVLSFFNGFRNRNRNDQYMDRLTTEIERAAGSLGYDILVYCDFRRSKQETYRYLNGGRSDGLIFFAPQADDPLIPYLRESRLPTVLINRSDPEGMLSSVIDDIHDGLRQVADKLASLGHRRIAIITDTLGGNPAAEHRTALLRKNLLRHGITVPQEWIIPCYDHEPIQAANALRFLMSEPEPPTALFCWHDRVGYEVLEQCDIQRVSVPDQLTLMGYDGLVWSAATHHTLASISLNIEVVADAAVDLLLSLIRGHIDTQREHVLPVTLTPGTTLGPPRK